MYRSWRMMIAVSGSLLVGACASSTPAPMALQPEVKNTQVPTHGSSEEYRMGPGDLLHIDVFQAEDLSRKVRISRHGDISLPLIGTVRAAGLTSRELESSIAQKLKERYLQDPQLSVFIEEFTSQRVTIEGQVKKPGVYSLTGGNTTLLQAVAMAGGPEEVAATKRVQLFRANEDGTKEAYVFDIDSVRTGQAADPPIKGDDVIVVHKDRAKVFTKGVSDVFRNLFHIGAAIPLF